MPRVVHFDMSAEDPDRAAQFYTNVFGWQFQKWSGSQEYWLITTGPASEAGIDGGLSRRTANNAHVTNTIDVPSVDDACAKITAHGGRVTAPKMAIPAVGWLAYCEDSEGNPFGVMQSDSSAR